MLLTPGSGCWILDARIPDFDSGCSNLTPAAQRNKKDRQMELTVFLERILNRINRSFLQSLFPLLLQYPAHPGDISLTAGPGFRFRQMCPAYPHIQ